MPQGAWSEMAERRYQHVKESVLDRGKSEDRAEEIAARTVNKQRREEVRTKNRKLDDRTLDELRNRARRLGIEGRSSMIKSELISAIRSSA